MIDGYAVVTDLQWIREWTHVMGFLLPFPLRVFGNDERDEAIAWLSALPEGPGVTHHLLPESGVLVVEVTAPLRAQDFDALAATADTWLETHDALPGVVIHARAFPGWENSAACCVTSASCATTTVRSAGWRWPPTARWPTSRPPGRALRPRRDALRLRRARRRRRVGGGIERARLLAATAAIVATAAIRPSLPLRSPDPTRC